MEKGAFKTRGKLKDRLDCKEVDRIFLLDYNFIHCLNPPHINGSLELALKSDNVPNDRIWIKIK